MNETTRAIQTQYGHGSLLDALDAGLERAGFSQDSPTVEILSAVDEFHIRGREATRELVESVSLPDQSEVLDVGCGIGGTARFLAEEYGAQVIGVDLCEEYCEVGRELTRRVGLADRVTFRQGDGLDLPAEDERFDLVFSEHVQMNVADNEGFIQEMTRVLRPGGSLAFHEIVAGPQVGQHYPVPWADDPSVSFLIPPGELRNHLRGAGLTVERWENRTEEGRAWFERILEKVREDGPPPLGLHLLMGADAKEKMQNVARNLAEERIEIVMATALKRE